MRLGVLLRLKLPRGYSKLANTINILHAIFTDFIYKHQPDILATETWFSDRESAPKTQCTPDGCKFLIILVLVVREEVPDYFLKTIPRLLRLPVVNVNHFNTRNGKLLRVYFIIVYRPTYFVARPVTSAVFFVTFVEYLESVLLSGDPLFIVGNFNIHIDSNENSNAIKLLELLQSFSPTKYV